MSTSAQNKKVALVTFYVNKTLNVGKGINPINVVIGTLAKDPNFDLSGILSDFHNTFVTDYVKQYPFDLIDEKTIIESENYKNIDCVDSAYSHCLTFAGYKALDVSGIYKKHLNKLKAAFPDVDGFLFVFMDFEIMAKVAFAGMGTAAINARMCMKLWNKNGDRVFNVSDGEFSTGTVPLVSGVPVMTSDKILPLCREAAQASMKAFKTKLPKLIKKIDSKL